MEKERKWMSVSWRFDKNGNTIGKKPVCSAMTYVTSLKINNSC